MDIFIHHYAGAKDILVEDIIDLIGEKEIESSENYAIVKNVSKEELAILSFRLQCAIHIWVYLSKTNYQNNLFDSIPNLKNNFNEENLKPFLNDVKTFAISTVKVHNISTPTPDISSEIGSWFDENIQSFDVNIKNPDLPISSLITENEIILGVDIIGFSLSKRPYKIALHAGSINGVLAYTISRLAGITKNNTVVDPFCGGGTIPIEVATYQQETSTFQFENKFNAFKITHLKDIFEKESKTLLENKIKGSSQVYGFDNFLKVIQGAQKNAKLSGLFEALNFSKVDIDWIDSKFNEGDVDIIISNPPQISNRTGNKKQILKTYNDLFYQGKYLLGKKGKLSIILIHEENILEIAKKHHFKEIKRIPMKSGGQEYIFIQFQVK